MKKIIMMIMLSIFMCANAFAFGFKIPFMEKEITFFENGIFSLDDIEDKKEITNYNFETKEEVQNSYYVGNYVQQYPELADKYQNKVFLIKTDKRILQGKLVLNHLILTSENIDYEIIVEDENKLIGIVESYILGEDVSISEIEDIVEMPMSIRIDIMKNFLFN